MPLSKKELQEKLKNAVMDSMLDEIDALLEKRAEDLLSAQNIIIYPSELNFNPSFVLMKEIAKRYEEVGWKVRVEPVDYYNSPAYMSFS